jgi:hypothetical protein
MPWNVLEMPFSKLTAFRSAGNDVIDESERLRPEALDQRNIELLLAESNLVSWNIKRFFCCVSKGWYGCLAFGEGTLHSNISDFQGSLFRSSC